MCDILSDTVQIKTYPCTLNGFNYNTSHWQWDWLQLQVSTFTPSIPVLFPSLHPADEVCRQTRLFPPLMPNHWEEMSELSLNRADFVQTSQKKRSNTCNYKACYIPPSWKKKIRNVQLSILLARNYSIMHENLCPRLNYGKYCCATRVATWLFILLAN